ncbi:hypothetical protein PENARI_c026G10257 [Penicillium arizonense]|uniref:CHAT domain-containing protein n=1 Tax=Penicillium arizonense TaxID=1835702 RepID=A0A1F5L771_PENAI|nr:hypothetical protein PENARI_c026G10257 [Penicillium arizonense]OGE48761.1 hypothetical protein PENARI_c026G10257 [Penicillium arizonense]
MDFDLHFLEIDLLNNFEELIASIAVDDNEHRAVLGCYYAELVFEQFKLSDRIQDLEEAVEKAKWAELQAKNLEHSVYARILGVLGNILERRFQCMGQIEDLEEAIQVLRHAVEISSDNHLCLSYFLHSLGNKLGARYNHTEKIEDLEEVVQVSRQMVKATPNAHPSLPGGLSYLGHGLRLRYERIGMMDDLEEAVQVSRQAVNLTPDNHADLPSRLHTLGQALVMRCDSIGKMENLEEAIRMLRQALDMTAIDHPERVNRLNGLAIGLTKRHHRTGNMEDLKEAVQMSLETVVQMPNDHRNMTLLLASLGTHLSKLYRCIGLVEVLEMGIEVSRRAVEIATDDDCYLPLILRSLGNRLGDQYKHTQKIEDLEEAVKVSRQGLKATPNAHPNLPGGLSDLGNHLRTRYERIGMMDDFEEAIQVSRHAVNLMPNNHPDLASYLQNLSENLNRRYKDTGEIQDLEEAIRVSLQAVTVTAAPPLVRILGFVQAIELLQSQGNYGNAYTLSEEAIDLLPLVHNRSLSIQDQQYVVSFFFGMAADACSLALQVGQAPIKALELLERGRGVILSLLMDDRSDTSELRAVNPTLCEQYENLRLEIHRPFETAISSDTPKFMSERRQKAINDLEECLRAIRQLQGFSSFQKGPTAEQMKKASDKGNIIIVNVTVLRSDAIIISSSGIKSVHLPHLDTLQAQEWVNQDLTSVSQSNRGPKNKAYRQFLSWLWRGCVKTILTELNYPFQHAAENLSRVWWVGTGLASTFPFHAACDLSADPIESVSSYILSSYIPSVKALIHARERVLTTVPPSGKPQKMLIVTMAETPGAGNLSGVKAEASAVVGVLGSSVDVEILDQPDTKSVLRHIHQCDIAHFACHGVSDSNDPSKSGLLLQTATEKPSQDVLSVSKICENHLAQGQIAYLSACSTAENRAEHLMDEVLHVDVYGLPTTISVLTLRNRSIPNFAETVL